MVGIGCHHAGDSFSAMGHGEGMLYLTCNKGGLADIQAIKHAGC